MRRYRIWLLDAEILGVYAQTAHHAECVAMATLIENGMQSEIADLVHALPALSWTRVIA